MKKNKLTIREIVDTPPSLEYLPPSEVPSIIPQPSKHSAKFRAKDKEGKEISYQIHAVPIPIRIETINKFLLNDNYDSSLSSSIFDLVKKYDPKIFLFGFLAMIGNRPEMGLLGRGTAGTVFSNVTHFLYLLFKKYSTKPMMCYFIAESGQESRKKFYSTFYRKISNFVPEVFGIAEEENGQGWMIGNSKFKNLMRKVKKHIEDNKQNV